MAEALNRKKKVRGGHRSSGTRTIAQIYEVIESTTRAGSDLTRLTQCKLALEEKLITVKQLDAEILDLVQEDELESEIEQADVFAERVQRAIIDANNAIDVREVPATLSTVSGVRTSDTLHSSPPPPVISTHSTRVKLPKLSLKKFNGDLTKWSTFWDCFESSVHGNSELSDVDKFNYLNSLLEGTAAEAVSGLKLTAVNYSEAIAILKKRFGNKQQIITKHMEILLHIEPVTSQYNIKGLRHLYDLVESQVRGLQALGVPAESFGSLLSSVLMNKLPQDLRLIVSREVKGDDWDLNELMKIIEGEVEARERALNSTSRASRSLNKDVPTATTLVSSHTNIPKCSYCRQPHSSSTCQTVTDPAERKQILKKTGRCFICLRKFHTSRECRSSLKCSSCSGRHHVSICPGRSSQNPTTNVPPPTNAASPASSHHLPPSNNPSVPQPRVPVGNSNTTSMYCDSTQVPVLLQTARAHIFKVSSPKAMLEVRVIFDSGSQRSYITNGVRKLLNLESRSTETMLIKTFGSTKNDKQICDVVSVGMLLKNGGVLELSLRTVPLICEPVSGQPVLQVIESYDYLSELELADYCSGDNTLDIDILIGCDHYWDLVTGDVIRKDNGPIAVHTKLGWVLSGPVEDFSVQGTLVNLVATHALSVDVYTPEDTKQDLDSRLKAFWDLESLGIKPDECSVYQEFEKTIEFKDNRYEVSLPWKHFHLELPDHYDLSLKRLVGLLKRLKETPEVLHQYNAIIQDQIKKGIVEYVDTKEMLHDSPVHYLPHHAVLREDKSTTKLRIVYDASASTSGQSLNECLYVGPKSGQNIMDILMRFRSHKIALAADIEKAFLMISVSKTDRDVLRFLWVKDINTTPAEIVTLRFTRVVFGVSSSPFLLNATINHHMMKYATVYPEFVETFMKSIYVDDISYGAEDDDAAFDLYLKSKTILAEGGFNLRKFVTNSVSLNQRIQLSELKFGKPEESNSCKVTEEDKTYTKDILGDKQHTEGEQKILGIKWNFVQDELVFDLTEMAILMKNTEPTKRCIVGMATRFYDPLGFMSPVTIRIKMFFQELCKSKVGWDEPLSGQLLDKWKFLVSGFKGVIMKIPRSYFWGAERAGSVCSLYGFCDASSGAYAAVVYIKVEAHCGSAVNFVASKTRVAPIDKLTIPRLELLSAVLLANLIMNVSNALSSVIQVDTVICFTDSKVSLYWIKGLGKEWKPFVQNRANEIRRLVPAQHWKHCSGKDNPADLPSRGVAPTDLVRNSLWQHGPSWLVDPTSDPDMEELVMPDECLREMSKQNQPILNLLTTGTSCSISAVINCENFSRLTRLLRVTAYVLRFCKMLKSKVQGGGTAVKELTASEMSAAEVIWLKESQIPLKQHNEFNVWKKQFGLFEVDGVWRCKGRLDNADLPYTTRHPALLYKHHHLTMLITQDAHERVEHNGVKETLTEIRTRYWIIKGRQFVKKVLHKCTICRRYEGLPQPAPLPPPLPVFRVKEEPAFTYTGVDFAGPLYIKAGGLTGSNKVWICLYTCCVVRAVHLDIVPDMTAMSFLRSFKRFTARRGFPKKFISDNGKTFKAAAKNIQAVVNHPDVQQYSTQVGMEWSFNLEKAPWWGGLFERMVKSMKRCLRKTIGRAKLTYDELLTAVTEVEMILNSRPLSYVSTEDIEEPLTPSHLIIGRRVLSLPNTTMYYSEDVSDDDFDLSNDALGKRMKHLNKTLDHFWKRWRLEYLVQLRESHRYDKGTNSSEKIQLGEIVLVHDEHHPRSFWKLGKVEKLIEGSDGEIRGAVIRIHSKRTGTSQLRRPLKLLYPLEIRSETTDDNQKVDSSKAQPLRVSSRTPPPKRTAAQRAKEWMRTVLADFEQ